MNKLTTVAVDTKLRDEYKKLCHILGWNISGRVEWFMRNEISGSR